MYDQCRRSSYDQHSHQHVQATPLVFPTLTRAPDQAARVLDPQRERSPGSSGQHAGPVFKPARALRGCARSTTVGEYRRVAESCVPSIALATWRAACLAPKVLSKPIVTAVAPSQPFCVYPVSALGSTPYAARNLNVLASAPRSSRGRALS